MGNPETLFFEKSQLFSSALLRCYLPFLLCWHLHWEWKQFGTKLLMPYHKLKQWHQIILVVIEFLRNHYYSQKKWVFLKNVTVEAVGIPDLITSWHLSTFSNTLWWNRKYTSFENYHLYDCIVSWTNCSFNRTSFLLKRMTNRHTMIIHTWMIDRHIHKMSKVSLPFKKTIWHCLLSIKVWAFKWKL